MAGTCGYGEGISGSINAGNFLTSCKLYCFSFSRRTLLHGVSKYVYTNIGVYFIVSILPRPDIPCDVCITGRYSVYY